MARDVFADRHDAGQQLASLLAQRDLDDPLVLALPRGGVPVAYEVATALNAPLEVFVSRKVGAPGRPEFGIGAVAEGSKKPVLGPQADQFQLTDTDLAVMVEMELDELRRRVDLYRDGRPLPDLANRTVILIDDGLATGVTAEAALIALWEAGATDVVLAVPTAAADTAARLSALAEVITVIEPPFFAAVGRWYEIFDQTSDEEVLDLLRRLRSDAPD